MESNSNRSASAFEESGFPETRPSLLIRLPDSLDEEAWRRFVDTYGPMIFRFAVRRGQSPADAADLLQEVLFRVSRSIGRFEYDPAKGRFRSWLFTIAWRVLINRVTQANRRDRVVAAVDVSTLDDPSNGDESAWDGEYRRQLLHRALPLVKPQFSATTWEAFSRTALANESIDSVASDLGISSGAVYVARSRVIGRLRDKVGQLDLDLESENPLLSR